MKAHSPGSVRPVIIIGAARSGTNILRDTLTCLPGLGTWPCDEINYIWRHGNTRRASDELIAQDARPSVQQSIRHAFDQIAAQQAIGTVVEKTCANSLRVEFVDQIFPDARYIFIVRDGRDVVASAMKRWAAPLDVPYILKKARYVPLSDLPYYGSRYFANRLYRLISGQKRLATWGPRFAGMQEMLVDNSLAAVCAMQWQRSIELSELGFAAIAPTRVHRLRYENFVQQPASELKAIAEFLEIPLNTGNVHEMTSDISAGSIGNWKESLSPQNLADVIAVSEQALRHHGYL